MDIRNPRYALDQGHPILEMEIDGKLVRLHREMKPTLVRNGIVVLGRDFVDTLPEIELVDRVQSINTKLKGCTRDKDVFRLAISFGLEVYYGRFRAGPAREQPDPEEVRALGDRLRIHALANSPSWQELTDF
jgi:hypothetical protein